VTPHPPSYLGHPLPKGEGWFQHYSAAFSPGERAGFSIIRLHSPQGRGLVSALFGCILPKGEGWCQHYSTSFSPRERAGFSIIRLHSPQGRGLVSALFGCILPKGEGWFQHYSTSFSPRERAGFSIIRLHSPQGRGLVSALFGCILPKGEGWFQHYSASFSPGDRAAALTLGPAVQQKMRDTLSPRGEGCKFKLRAPSTWEAGLDARAGPKAANSKDASCATQGEGREFRVGPRPASWRGEKPPRLSKTPTRDPDVRPWPQWPTAPQR
jgi:hypothetical protein